MATQDPPRAPKKGLWDSLTPQEQKKAITIFLCSLGITLLITGRSGGKMLKKAQAGEAGPVGQVQKAAQAGKATQATPTPLPPRQPPLSVRSRLTPAEEAASSPQPVPLPSSVLHPDSLVPPKPTRLLRSFVAPSPPDAPVSVLPSRPPASSYFLPNPQITSASKAFADEVERLDKLHENGTMEKQELPEGFNPALYAAKALGIATLITLGTFSAGVYGLMRWFGVDDLEMLAIGVRQNLPGFLDAHRPTIPSWAQPAPSPEPLDPNAPAPSDEAEEEELSYFASLKAKLDQEAEEDRLEKQLAWDRMRRRAEGIKGASA
ncbi:hypothetical protein RTBOTA2_003808 [Rhodotorula toruloides]|uniref:Transmembrane protein n=1 Tax=Rhodotorula toruloides TaxID=5286 RepID=A0A0K3CKL0_RHOTO|nr:hypothetical protein RTBOTA2_003808 [Rhodotorula toruloides]PRQ74731.1 hypothetical protein AAT19DRAFT_15084 [Rhodotorula toruloides]